jgi:beta-N-acetylhexosaminidase
MSDRVKKLVDKMTLEEKVGQMFVFGHSGSYLSPDILEMTDKYHLGGFRVVPWDRKFKRYLKPGHPGLPRVMRDLEPKDKVFNSKLECGVYMDPDLLANDLNTLRKRAMKIGSGIPYFYSIDFEGDMSLDIHCPGLVGFPSAMGIAASGSPLLARKGARAIARQLKAFGIDVIHSPVLDVNTNPMNPEIGAHSYSMLPETVAEYAAAAMLGFIDEGVIPVGKHFPGRGHSGVDAHFEIPVIKESVERMDSVHLYPYKKLIEKGLPMIMIAHSIYPMLDPTEEVATVSKPIITGVLREKLGFNGVVTTDSFTMGGLVARYEVSEAVVRAVEAGVDMILLKDESALRGEAFNGLLSAVRSRRVKEDEINTRVTRILSMKERFGLLDGKKGVVDETKVEKKLKDPENIRIAKEAAKKSTVVLRQQKGVIPVKKSTKILVIEEVGELHKRFNNSACHVGSLNEALLKRGYDAIFTDFDPGNFEAAWPVIQDRARLADLIIYTGYYLRSDRHEVKNYDYLKTLGKSVIFVGNSPFPTLVSPEEQNVIVTFSPFKYSMEAVADILTGKVKATAKLGFDPQKMY